MISEFMKWAEAVSEWTIAKRRCLHRQPELSGCEYKTAAFIRDILTDLGISWRAVGTGTIADLPSNGTRPLIALRADIDALAMQEQTDLPYASEVPGLMHACGHDTHTAMLLGAAKLLTEHPERLTGPVRLIFQPAEENGGGSKWMIAGGALDQVSAIYCLHAGPGLPAGQLATCPGVIHAASDGIRITVNGKSCHGSTPEYGTDAIVIASHIVIALQELISRETSAWEPAVLSIGAFHGGTARNIICDKVVMDATLRTLDEDVRAMLLKRIEEVSVNTAALFRGSASVELVQQYYSCRNHPGLTKQTMEHIEKEFGSSYLTEVKRPAMESEDFGAYEQIVPGVKLFIGTGYSEKLHTVQFRINEEMLTVGTAFFVSICCR